MTSFVRADRSGELPRLPVQGPAGSRGRDRAAGRARQTDAMADALRQRGERHEKAYIDTLRARRADRRRSDAASKPGRARACRSDAETLAAMRRGRTSSFRRPSAPTAGSATPTCCGESNGRAPSVRGRYEVLDTKLSRETRGGTILQLCAYTEMIGAMQGVSARSTFTS